MEATKRDVDELNELAKKITGTNPKSKTTAQALNYIEQNYSGGGGSQGGSQMEVYNVGENGEIDLTPEDLDDNKVYAIRKLIHGDDGDYIEISYSGEIAPEGNGAYHIIFVPNWGVVESYYVYAEAGHKFKIMDFGD